MPKKKSKYKDNTLFDTLKQITETKDLLFIENLPEEKRKNINPYILNRWLSMSSTTIVVADIMNQYVFNISLENYYKIVTTAIPKGKQWFQWVGSKKKQKHEKFLLDLIVREYECSKKEAGDYANILLKDVDKLKKLVLLHAVEDNELRKIGLSRKDLYIMVKHETKKKKIVEVKKQKEQEEFEDLFV